LTALAAEHEPLPKKPRYDEKCNCELEEPNAKRPKPTIPRESSGDALDDANTLVSGAQGYDPMTKAINTTEGVYFTRISYKMDEEALEQYHKTFINKVMDYIAEMPKEVSVQFQAFTWRLFEDMYDHNAGDEMGESYRYSSEEEKARKEQQRLRKERQWRSMFAVRVKPQIVRKTEPESKICAARSFANKYLRQHPDLPAKYDDPEQSWLNVESGAWIPPVSCGVRKCPWYGFRGSNA